MFTRKEIKKVGDLILTKEPKFDDTKIKLVEDMSTGKFDFKRKNILVDKNYKIIDGNHRVFLIKQYYGENYEIKIKKVIVNKVLYFVVVLSMVYMLLAIAKIVELIFLGPIRLTRFIIKQVKKLKNEIEKNRRRDTNDTEPKKKRNWFKFFRRRP